MARTRSSSRNVQPENPPQTEANQYNQADAQPEDIPEGNQSDTASSPPIVQKTRDAAATDTSVPNPDFALLFKTQESMLKRMENNELRDNLQRQEDLRAAQQRQEDLRAFQLMMEERFRKVETFFQKEDREGSRRKKERTPSSSSGSSRSNGPRSSRRDIPHTSASERKGPRHAAKKERLERIAEEEDRGRERASRRHGSPREYKMKYLTARHGGPFSEEIATAPYPKNLDLTHLPKYDGTQDPRAHLDTFELLMYVRLIKGPVISRLFAATLTGPAQKWFHTLPTDSIHNFEDLGRKFELNFATSKKQPMSQFTLSKIKQKKGETLQKYLDRFKDVALQVRSLPEDVHVHCIIDGIDPSSRLAKSIFKTPVNTLTEFHTRAKQYLDVEQMEIANTTGAERQDNASPGYKDQSGRKRQEASSRSRNRESRVRGEKGDPRGRYDRYAPLNAPRSQIWQEVAATEMKRVERPRPNRSRPSTDRSKFCAFHDGPGHTTDECFELRDAIEKFIREGKLRQYLIKTQGRKNNKRDRGHRSKSPASDPKKEEKRRRAASDEDEFPEAQFHCHAISGGFGGGGDTISQRKKYLREVLAVRNLPKFKKDHTEPTPPPLVFTHEELKDVVPGHQDGLVITGTLARCQVKRIFVDAGSSADIISWDAFNRMKMDAEDLKPCKTTLIGFNGEHSTPKGFIDLKLTLGTREAFRSERVRFIVADFPSPYNVILGRPTIHGWDMLVSTKHQKLKMVNKKNKIVVITGDQKESRQCYFETVREGEGGPSSPPRIRKGEHPSGPGSRQKAEHQINMIELDLRDSPEIPRPEPEGEMEELVLGQNPAQTTKIGAGMTPDLRARLIEFLRENQDVFAWTSSEIPGIDPNFCCHKLAVRPGSTPVAQKKRHIGADRQKALEDHVQELLAAGFIREVQYTTWLSNVVMVKKPNGKWRVCTDYTSLNKACPKDSYPMPNIDQLVDNSSGFQLLSFMDAYSGYNQIAMHPADQEKTAFMTDKANYCYNVMPFGLKNAGATYQRMMNRVFADQIGQNVEVYIDDMIVKTKDPDEHIRDLEQTFEKLRRYRIRLNPAKCAFGVPAGKFLGFMLTSRGIEVNPDKCKAVLDMQAPRTKKEVQQLTGRLAALTRFLPRSAENALPFFRLLKKETQGGWNPDCEAAFERIKLSLATPPVLSKPDPGEPLFLYLSIGEEAVSAALVRETDAGQAPIYFISKALQNSELRYQKLEKVAFALLTAARRLRPYFQGHPITVRTSLPLRQILHKPDLAGRMTSWAIQLSEFDITYEARRSIKSQALADFLRELTPAREIEAGEDKIWTIYVDGSSNAKGSGAGIILESPEGITIEHSLQLTFPTSNNQAEYEALIAGLLQAREHGAQRVKVFTDSQLVAAQIEGTYQTKGPLLAKYLNRAKEIISGFQEAIVTHIPREENARADILSKLASTKGMGNHRTVVQQNLAEPSCVMTISSATDWRKPIQDYLERGIIPTDHVDARKLIREAAVYTTVDDQLYRKGLHSPMMRCLGPSETKYVLEEIHEGISGHHMGGKALARKALRAGYYWPTMLADAQEAVKKCDSCQKHARIIWPPPAEMKGITAPWPFYKWGMDLLGPFKAAPGQLKWLVVAVDYFTKWIEAEPLATITSARVQRFFRVNIVSRFGIPAEIVTDNGTQFIDKGFRDLMADLGIQQHFASVEHPQSNGQAEAANKIVLDGLKKRMQDAESNWVEQLYSVLWGYRTSVQTATQETPFRLTYGSEAMLPVEIGQPSWRKRKALQDGREANEDALRTELDLIDELRVTAHCREIATKQLIAAKYNRKVRPRSFNRGNLVLRRADIGNKNARDGKLAANWEGPYRVKEKLDNGAYILETLGRKPIRRTWNADKLRIYYS